MADADFDAAVEAAVAARLAEAMAAAQPAAPAAQQPAAPADAAAAAAAPAADAAAAVGAVTVTLPTFWTSDPELWFYQANLVFAQSRITRSATKYGLACAKIPVEVLSSIKKTINGLTAATPDPYEQLRDALTKSHGMSRWHRGFAIMRHPELGDRRPSRMMSDMLALLPADTEPELLFFCHFLNRLPAYIRDNVAAGNHKTAEDMAEAADRLWDAHSSNPVTSVLEPLAAVSLRGRSQSPREGRRRSPDRRSPSRRPADRRRSKSRDTRRRRDEDDDPDLCFYHNRWGSRAKKCESGCNWTKN
jgi:hypothetical protein